MPKTPPTLTTLRKLPVATVRFRLGEHGLSQLGNKTTVVGRLHAFLCASQADAGATAVAITSDAPESDGIAAAAADDDDDDDGVEEVRRFVLPTSPRQDPCSIHELASKAHSNEPLFFLFTAAA